MLLAIIWIIIRTKSLWCNWLPADGRLAIGWAFRGAQGLANLSLCQAKGQAPDLKSFGKFSDFFQIHPIHLSSGCLRICWNIVLITSVLRVTHMGGLGLHQLLQSRRSCVGLFKNNTYPFLFFPKEKQACFVKCVTKHIQIAEMLTRLQCFQVLAKYFQRHSLLLNSWKWPTLLRVRGSLGSSLPFVPCKMSRRLTNRVPHFPFLSHTEGRLVLIYLFAVYGEG